MKKYLVVIKINKKLNILIMKIIFTIFIYSFLLGCQKSPGEECLQSFSLTLKDPNSGKVIDFTDPILTYTATNSYGARIQAKAICYKLTDGKWGRSQTQELIRVIQLSNEKITSMTKCQKIGNSASKCFGGSAALERAYKMNHLGSDKALEDLNREAAQELGFD